MRIVQSLWSCGETDFLRFKGGWLAPEYNLMSWALSSLQLAKYYKDLVLYADNASARMLIDVLKLPYTQVINDLDLFNDYNPKLWALPKIYTYANQESPFLHVDGDVYLWERFNNDLLNSDLIAQNLEIGSENYVDIFHRLESGLPYFPPEVIEERKSSKSIYAYNAGIMGGHDVKFFKAFKTIAFEFVEMNSNYLNKVDILDFNILFEQYLFYCLAKKNNKKVGVYFKDVIGDNKYSLDFTDTPFKKKYTHLIGVYKKNKQICNQLAYRLREYYPDFYYRIIALFKDSKITLYRDYYFLNPENSEVALKKRYLSLSSQKSFLFHDRDSIVNEGLIFFRKGIISQTIATLQNTAEGKDIFQNGEIHLMDLEHLEEAIFKSVKHKFSKLSIDFLYSRDINSSRSVDFVFGDHLHIGNRIVVADENTEIISCEFDWSLVDDSVSFAEKIYRVLCEKPSKILIGIVPECDRRAYSLVGIDKLDLLILKLIREPLTIKILLEELQKSFHSDDMKNLSRFENLIYSRLKFGMLHKTIKVVFSSET